MKRDAHTFKHAGYTAQAHSTAPGEFALNVWWTNEDSAGHQAILPATDAPALALAILEAAGHVRDACSDNDADVAMEWLHSAIARQAKQSAEAKEQAELEAEALELCNEYVRSADAKPYDSWEDIVRVSKRMAENWLAVARRSREMRAEK